MAKSDVTIVDGSLDWKSGVDSLTVTTIASARNPNGLQRDELAWLVNGSVRGGSITSRFGWKKICDIPNPNPGNPVYQGGLIYEPVQNLGFDPSGGFPLAPGPQLMVAVGGHIMLIDLSVFIGNVVDLSFLFGKSMASDACHPHFYFLQAEQFVVIQDGTGITLPLIFDNFQLRQSKGITNPAVAPGTPGVNEIPAAYAMDYYMGRIWYAQGQFYSAGDIIGGPSGTVGYDFTDSILEVTENPLVVGGDGFKVGSNHGLITTLFHTAELDAAFGQGNLYVGTPKAVYRLQVPVSRTDWIAANNNNQPLQTVVALGRGPINDRSVVPVNSDVFYQTRAGVESLALALRYFQQWGNTPLSSNEFRAISQNNYNYMDLCSGVEFDNRLLQTALPKAYGPICPTVAYQGIIPLDLAPISDFRKQLEPSWEGIWEGLDHLQLLTGNFGGVIRCFSIARNRATTGLEVWEITDDQLFENGDNRIEWQAEFPAFNWGDEFELKTLVSGELWLDEIVGTVVIRIEYRPDGSPCWLPWVEGKECSARNSAESGQYPNQVYQPGWRSTISLPLPPRVCNQIDGRPSNQGFQFQPRIFIKGSCRIRGLLLYAQRTDKALYQSVLCR